MTTACFCPNHEEDIELNKELTTNDLLDYVSTLESSTNENITLDDIICERLCVEVVNSSW